VGEETVGRWGNIIDPLDHTWVHLSGQPYHHNELSVCSSRSPDNYTAVPGLHFDADGVAYDGEGYQIDSGGNQFADYRDE
jgi:hypothetical protein